MKITFNKNIQFTRLLKVHGRLREFNFRKANAHANGVFTVDVLDEESPMGNRIIFKMELKDNEWKIVTNGLPIWVLEKEATLREIIAEELSTN
ncbi:MAG: hypothetical protein JST81_00190 [Bacteroidetes bacterium]|nr:hypothetical protein [Bacteroidota bacterium]